MEPNIDLDHFPEGVERDTRRGGRSPNSSTKAKKPERKDEDFNFACSYRSLSKRFKTTKEDNSLRKSKNMISNQGNTLQKKIDLGSSTALNKTKIY